MIKKTIKYTDFNGIENEETFYFNLTKAEGTMLELGMKGGMHNYIKGAVESGDNSVLVETFSKIILDSYGVKSADGKRFVKSETLKEEFKQSAAFSALFMEIIADPQASEAFFSGVVS